DTQSAEQMESLASCASHAKQLGDELLQTMLPIANSEHTINLIIESILSDAQLLPSGTGNQIERIYAPSLPPFMGSVDGLTRVIRILVSHAQRYIATMGGRRRLRISTALRAQHHPPNLESPYVAAPLHELEIRIHEVDSTVMTDWVPVQSAGDLLDAHVGVKELGGRLEFLDSVGGRLSIALWVPVQSPLGFDDDSDPLSRSHEVVDVPDRGLIPNMVHEMKRIGAPSTHHPTDRAHMLPDRRTCVRRAVNLPIRLTIGNSVRQGAMTDLSSLGASLEVEGVCAPLERQTAHLIFQTEAGSYEIHATVRHSRAWLQRNDVRSQATRVAVQFSPLNNSQREVLASYIDEACARAGTITVEVILPPAPTTEGRDVTPSSRGVDHRETMRVQVSLPARMELPNRPDAHEWPRVVVVNLSRGGACIQTESPIDTMEHIVALHFSSAGVDNQPRVHEPEVPEAVLIGHIVHRDTDCGMSEERRSDRSRRGTRLGIRFVRLVPFSEREINRVMAQHLDVPTNRSVYGENTSIISTRRDCRNARHQVIVGTDDHVRDQISPSTPILLIVPGFGLTKSDYLPLAYHLAANRFRTLRYDHTNHVGQSDGDITQLTMRGMQADLQNVLAFVHATWPTASVSVLAEDLAARVAIKVLARNTVAARLFLLNPVLDIGTALSTSSRHGAIGGYRNASQQGVANLWGLNVNVDQFIADVIAGGYADVASSAADIAQLATPPVIFTSPRVNRRLEQVFGSQAQSLRAMGSTPVVIPLQIDISGESGTWDERHLTAFRTICKVLSPPTRDNQPASHVRSLQMRDVHQQRRLEQERIRIRHQVSQATREALSVAYLAQLSQLEQLPSYRMLINELHQRLLPLDPGGTVLDIGCGMGDFAETMLTNSIYRMSHQGGAPVLPLRYIGLDLSHEALKSAQQRVQTFGRELLRTVKAAVPVSQFLETYWVQTNRTASLPVLDESIDRVLCQLALPFTVSPLECLRQSLRVLHPDGTAIVTCFQPQTDLSILFRQHYRATGVDESSPQSQIVLHFLGRVREAIRQGILHHYERNEFASLLSHAGASVIQIYPALENQLLLAIVRKGKSTG
ncbi:MAG: PilZ domain-containing protein, partial [Nitrospira sp.]|nr:PilZ domain-containing protein [Nitrospira sp.]